MLIWLIATGGVDPRLVKAAQSATEKATTLPGKSAANRKRVPWEEVAIAL